MVLYMYGKQDLVFQEEAFQMPAPSQSLGKIAYADWYIANQW